MDIFEALDTLEEANIIVERKSVKDMTPEEYKADLEARRERRRLRKERSASQKESGFKEDPEELRRKNAEQIAKGYEDAEREIKSELSTMKSSFNDYYRMFNMDKSKNARTALKAMKNIKDRLESGNLLADVRTSFDASKFLDEIQSKISEVRKFINGNKQSRYMDEFRYLEVTFNRTPTNDGRPMDEWGKAFRIYVWELPDRFDPRYNKVSKSEFTKWLSRLKCKYLKKFKSGTRRNRITWDTYDVYSTVYEIVSKDGWTYKSNVYFEAHEKEDIVIRSVRTNTGERLL